MQKASRIPKPNAPIHTMVTINETQMPFVYTVEFVCSLHIIAVSLVPHSNVPYKTIELSHQPGSYPKASLSRDPHRPAYPERSDDTNEKAYTHAERRNYRRVSYAQSAI